MMDSSMERKLSYEATGFTSHKGVTIPATFTKWCALRRCFSEALP